MCQGSNRPLLLVICIPPQGTPHIKISVKRQCLVWNVARPLVRETRRSDRIHRFQAQKQNRHLLETKKMKIPFDITFHHVLLMRTLSNAEQQWFFVVRVATRACGLLVLRLLHNGAPAHALSSFTALRSVGQTMKTRSSLRDFSVFHCYLLQRMHLLWTYTQGSH